ncbi:profilin-like [Antedon mediterranea]|uniref:profilin-like n=1 Tax=Antedon mediterranea TaxID=105859 RepID=UPI003AF47F4D
MGFICLIFLVCFSLVNPVYTQSWDSYIDYLIAQTKDASGTEHADQACIIGLDGGAKWTTDGHANAYKLTTSEATDIAVSFKSEDFSAFMASGIQAEGVQYQFLREDEVNTGLLVLGKLKDHGAITMQSSKTAIVIAHTIEGEMQGNTNKGVAVIAEYLESLGM